MASFLRMSGSAGFSVRKWAVGAMIATPSVAVLQGCLMLNDYRKNHRDAPHPISPSQGVVVVSPDDATASAGSRRRTTPNSFTARSDAPPIRLLVIGDSLAAGVGISKSGTPVLPESIARSLSKALGGRSVYWTCAGTPGACASQIADDVKNIDQNKNNNKLNEWHEVTLRVQKWLKNRELRKSIQQTQDSPHASNLTKWWRGVRSDIQNLRAVIQNKSVESTNRKALERRESSRFWDQHIPTTSSPVFNDPNFDLVVVLTGLNDLKNSMLPWMRQMDAQNGDGGLQAELLRVVQALKSKMKLDLRLGTKQEQKCNIKTEKPRNEAGRPLVVLPALPASSLPIFHRAPFSWFAFPLLNAMDHDKKVLSERFPRSVLFVEPPSLSILSDFEAGRGELWAKRQTEEVLLKLTDATQRAREKVEHLMAQHYRKWTDDQEHSTNTRVDESLDAFEQSCHYHQWVNSSRAPGASLVSADMVHPNDLGYDFWGRHIAEAIIKEWRK